VTEAAAWARPVDEVAVWAPPRAAIEAADEAEVALHAGVQAAAAVAEAVPHAVVRAADAAGAVPQTEARVVNAVEAAPRGVEAAISVHFLDAVRARCEVAAAEPVARSAADYFPRVSREPRCA
jgi:hypothetical protein